MRHYCHAHGCNVVVPPSMMMCKSHWYALPKATRDAIWREYRRGQEVDKSPSIRYLAVQRLAVAQVAFRPHDEEAAKICAQYMRHALYYRELAVQNGQGDPLEGLALSRATSAGGEG
jgi:hypothetical protein